MNKYLSENKENIPPKMPTGFKLNKLNSDLPPPSSPLIPLRQINSPIKTIRMAKSIENLSNQKELEIMEKSVSENKNLDSSTLSQPSTSIKKWETIENLHKTSNKKESKWTIKRKTALDLWLERAKKSFKPGEVITIDDDEDEEEEICIQSE